MVEAIAELSTQMHMQQTMQSVGTAVLKQTMEMVETQAKCWCKTCRRPTRYRLAISWMCGYKPETVSYTWFCQRGFPKEQSRPLSL